MSDNAQAIRRYSVMQSETRSRPLSSVGMASAGSKIFSLSFVEVVRREDPGALLTYVNYPTTEYLELPFIDFRRFQCVPGVAGAARSLFGTSAEPRWRATAASD